MSNDVESLLSIAWKEGICSLHFSSKVYLKVSGLFSLTVCFCLQITNLHGSRVLDIMFIDVGVQASVEVFELREIPPLFLRDLMAIPPQVSIEMWKTETTEDSFVWSVVATLYSFTVQHNIWENDIQQPVFRLWSAA